MDTHTIIAPKLSKSKSFHGSYEASDVTFLLKQLTEYENLPPLEKEKMIQSGQRHYSEMLNPEKLPSSAYMSLFHQAMLDNGSRMAKHCVALANNIVEKFSNHESPPIIVSLARAGTPVGVVIKHLISQIQQVEIAHYSISIIRDRGIDANAISYILRKHNSDGSNLIFIDGWTGKGVITGELVKAVNDYNAKYETHLQPHLYVLSDLAGVAWQSASFEDYLIPSAILNSTVSGLVSRSILDKQIGAEDFHGCVYFEEFLKYDFSQQFVQELIKLANEYIQSAQELSVPSVQTKENQKHKMAEFINEISSEFNIVDVNLIKPGIGEATRVLLRRVPERLIIQSLTDTGIQHLIVLANEKSVEIFERPDMPFKAVSIIKSTS